MTATPDPDAFADELRHRLREQAAACLQRRRERSAARAAFNAARLAGKTRHHQDRLAKKAGKNKEKTMTTTKWRTYTGAEYDDVREIPCAVIAAGHLFGGPDEPIYEGNPEIKAEIDRRGWDVYRDHGYGEGHHEDGWGNIPVASCDHTRCGETAAIFNGWASGYSMDIVLTSANVATILAQPLDNYGPGSIERMLHQIAEGIA